MKQPRYHYATLPALEVCESAQILTNPDSYIADDRTSKAARELLQKGYRWIRTDVIAGLGGWAVFEKQV